MKKLLTALWKILVLTIVDFLVQAVLGIALPLSNDLMAAMSPADQASFMPLLLINTLINMTVLYMVLHSLRFKGWKLFFGTWMSFFGLFTVLNAIELYWYNESFPLLSYADVHILVITGLISHGLTALIGTWLTGGFRKAEEAGHTDFVAGRLGWKILVFSAAYPFFYFLCGFITRLFPEVRSFYAGWAATMEPLHILLLFNVIRGALWFLFSAPLLLGTRTRKQAFWLVPLVLVTGTAGSVITPSAFMPGIVRLAHFIELTISMSLIGVFLAWFFLRERPAAGAYNDE